MRGLLSVSLLFCLNGCFVYEPVGNATPDPGQEIRAHLYPRDFDIGSVTVRDVTRVDGIVYDVMPDTVAVWSNCGTPVSKSTLVAPPTQRSRST